MSFIIVQQQFHNNPFYIKSARMLSHCRTLLRRIVFSTTNSRKQTTPHLIRDPVLTKQGMLQPKSKSYAYDLDKPHVVNRHLYWNRTQDNKIVRNRNRLRRFKKLGIRPLHEQGTRVVDRPLPEILRELRDRHLIIKSPGRTYANLKELFQRFPEQIKQNSQLIDYAVGLLNRQLPVMTFKQFYVYIQLLKKTGKSPNEQLFYHFYNYLMSAYLSEKPLKFMAFASLCKWFFNGKMTYPSEVLLKNNQPLKLFEDNEPRIKSFEEIVDKLYGKEYLKSLVKSGEIKESNSLSRYFNGMPTVIAQKLHL